MTSDFWTLLDQLVSEHEIVIDRPQGSAHPHFADMIYPLDYGYLAGTTSGGGQGIDVWRGSTEITQVTGIACTADVWKNDAEIKILLGCSEQDMATISDFLNGSESLRCMVVKRP